MMQWLLVFFAQFTFVGLRAFQQRNVAFDNYKAILPTSIAMSTIEAFVIANIAKSGFSISTVSAMALGASIGSLIAMKAHKKWLKTDEKK